MAPARFQTSTRFPLVTSSSSVSTSIPSGVAARAGCLPTLALTTTSPRAGTVAFWSPTVIPMGASNAFTTRTSP